jgi:large subunit ribosomal protein L4
MPIFEVYNRNGEVVDKVELSSEIFAKEINQHVIWLVVKAQLAARRAGTHSVKNRSAVKGGSKKPYRQKGTGWARQGTRRAPHFVGGGRAFGPTPRSYAHSLNKKVKLSAVTMALSLRASEKKIFIVDDLNIGEIKTKTMTTIIETFKAKKALIVESAENREVRLSVRNLKKHKWLPPEAVNVYDILNHDTLIMNVSTARELDSRLSKPVR